MGITSHCKDVIDLLIVDVLQKTSSVGLIAVPSIVVDNEISLLGSLGCPSMIDPEYQCLSEV
jgi:hypothetical protein